MPGISACVPVYRVPPAYLADLLESLAQQRRKPDEVVINDDASGIDYSDVIRRYQNSLIIRYQRNDENLGMVGNWNAAVARCREDLVIILGHDDRVAPEMFADYEEAFQAHERTALVCSGSLYIGPSGAPVEIRNNVNGRDHIFRTKDRYRLDGREATRLCLRNGAALGELSVHMFRRADFEAIGGYDAAFGHAADIDLAIRIANRGDTIYINRPYLHRRMHADNLTWTNLATGRVTDDRAALFEKYKATHDFTPDELARFRAYLVACACYDLVRTPRHRSLRVIRTALSQIRQYSQLRPDIYLSACAEIVTGENRDAR
jgi:glycosyltransferase involved in cell wall biosynthesis